MACSFAKPCGAANRAFPDDPLSLPLEGPGRCCHRGRSLLRTTDRKPLGPEVTARQRGLSRGGFPIGLPFGGCHRSTTPLQRAPERKPGSEALTEPSIGLRNANRTEYQVMLVEPNTKFPWHYPSRVPSSQSSSRAEQRGPAAKNRHFCPAVVIIDDSSQLHGQNARLFALSESPYANNRQKRPSLASETAKNRLF